LEPFRSNSSLGLETGENRVTRSQKRISGLLLDRIDIHMQVPRVEFAKMRDIRLGETSAEVRTRVETAQEYQRKRFAGTDIASNAYRRPAQIRNYCSLEDPCQALVETAMRQLQLTARAYHRALKLNRTIADLTDAKMTPRCIWRRRCSTGPSWS
jgi:magnesium chelatase family protein